MKLDKNTVQRRIDLMAEEGVTFACNTEVGSDATSLMDDFDAVVLAIGSTVPNNLPIPGRELDGIHFAMEFLTANQKRYALGAILGAQFSRRAISRRAILGAQSSAQSSDGLAPHHHLCRLFADPAAVSNGAWSGLTSKYSGDFIDAANKNVVVIGGGDTGTDCIGTSLRHGCETLTNFELFPQPPDTRAEGNPWPAWPRIYRTDYGHEEAAHRYGEDQRRYSILSKEFVGDESGKVKAVKTTQISVGADGRFEEVAGTEKEWPADLVVLAMGFRHPEATISETLKLEADARNNVKANTADYRTSSRGVFAAGDCRRGQSLVVWAINEGRNSAAACDAYLRQGPEASW